MSKQLILVRHGKSDWPNSASLTDFDRPLNARGKKNAREMAERLLKRGFTLDLMISSPAKRAKATANYFAEVFNFQPVVFEPSIYEANTNALLKVVNNFDNQFNTAIMFGHNPGFTDFSNNLANTNIYNIPTAGMVVLDFPFDAWELVSFGTGELLLFDYPKNAGDGD